MSFFRKNIPPELRFAALIYALWLMSLFMFRVAFWFRYVNSESTIDHRFTSFLIGFGFDLMAISYMMLLPFLLLCISVFIRKNKKPFRLAAVTIIAVLFVLSILISLADLNYYSYYSSRITTAIHMWSDNVDQMFIFLFSHAEFLFPILLFLALTVFSVWFITVISREIFKEDASQSAGRKTVTLLLAAMLLFLGMRGGHIKRPIGMREAFFSMHALVNQATLNPVLTYFDSFEIFKVNYTDESTALMHTKKYLGMDVNAKSFERFQPGDALPESKNIVLILMESMTAGQMGFFNTDKKLTPFLDSLSRHSLFFTNHYSAGIHTHNGVFSSLFGFPSIMAKHPFSDVSNSGLIYQGMPKVLKDKGYATVYFCSHAKEFDNLGYFLPRNGFDQMFGLQDFPIEKSENEWGVNDEFLFDFSLHKIDSIAAANKKFFATVLTISTHPPQQFPKQTSFKPNSKLVFDQVYEYADNSLKQFFENVKNKPWYRNTLFVLVGDHGVNLNQEQEAPLSLNHVPLLFFNPDTNYSKIVTNAAMQLDIFPTALKLAGVSFSNNSLGMDLLSHNRQFAFFTQDNRLCILNDSLMLVINKSGAESLYNYKTNMIPVNSVRKEQLINDMKDYAYSFLQTTQWMQAKNNVSGN